MFSFKRFFEQFKILWLLKAQRQALTLVVLALVIIYIDFKIFYFGDGSFDFGFWGVIISVITILNSSNVFSALLQPSSGIHYYMTPASIGEKYAAAWLFSSIVTMAVYSLTILLVHVSSVTVGNMITGQALSYNLPEAAVIKKGFLDLMFVQSLFFLGSVLFRKNPFGKTLLSIIAFGFIIGLVGSFLLKWYLTGNNSFFNLDGTTSYTWSIHADQFNAYDLPATFKPYYQTFKVIGTSIPFICWIVAYFRLKTREI